MKLEFYRLTEDYKSDNLTKFLNKYNKDEYNTQAVRFLHDTETDINIAFERKGKYFDSDTEARNIYRVTMANKNGFYSFSFGDSIHNTQEIEKVYSHARKEKFRPSPYSVLACLDVYNCANFGEFCDEFGYEKCDENNYEGNFINESSMKTYRAVKEQEENLLRMFDASQLEQLQELN